MIALNENSVGAGIIGFVLLLWAASSVFAFYGIGIGLTVLSPSLGVLAVSFSLITGLAATPLVSTLWTVVDLFCKGKTGEQATLHADCGFGSKGLVWGTAGWL